MAQQDKTLELSHKLVKILQDLLDKGDWDATLFLQTAHKKIQSLQDEAQALYQEIASQHEETPEQEKYNTVKKQEGYIPVYISVYQSDYLNLQKWQQTLSTLTEYSVSRPIYRLEEHIQAMIRAKPDYQREGYVAIYVKESDIISPHAGKIMEDRLGNELLTLREGAIRTSNILKFVHGDREFRFIKGKLFLKEELE